MTFSCHLLAATGSHARTGSSSETEGWGKNWLLHSLVPACEGCRNVVGTFQIIGICIDRFWTYLKIKSILKSQKKHSQKSPQGLWTHLGHVLGGFQSIVERSFLAGYWSIIFITNIGMNRREKRGKGNTTKAGYIMMIQKIDLDVLPLTYT